MKLYRFMSFEEFNKYLRGETIEGKRYYKARTTSHGVCFLPEEVEIWVDRKDYGFSPDEKSVIRLEPDWYMDFMGGIVSEDVLLCVEAPETSVRAGEGVYANPLTDAWYDYIFVPEFSVDSYDISRFTPVACAYYPRTSRKLKWEDLHSYEWDGLQECVEWAASADIADTFRCRRG